MTVIRSPFLILINKTSGGSARDVEGSLGTRVVDNTRRDSLSAIRHILTSSSFAAQVDSGPIGRQNGREYVSLYYRRVFKTRLIELENHVPQSHHYAPVRSKYQKKSLMLSGAEEG